MGNGNGLVPEISRVRIVTVIVNKILSSFDNHNFQVTRVRRCSITALNEGSWSICYRGNDRSSIPNISVTRIVAPIVNKIASFLNNEFKIRRSAWFADIRALDERTGTIAACTIGNDRSLNPFISIRIVAPVVNEVVPLENDDLKVGRCTGFSNVRGLNERTGTGGLGCDDRSFIPHIPIGIVTPIMNEIVPLEDDSFKIRREAWFSDVTALNERCCAAGTVTDDGSFIPFPIGIVAPVMNHVASLEDQYFEISGMLGNTVGALDERSGGIGDWTDDYSTNPGLFGVGIVAVVVCELFCRWCGMFEDDGFEVGVVACYYVGTLNETSVIWLGGHCNCVRFYCKISRQGTYRLVV
jgi:hypothetical protein